MKLDTHFLLFSLLSLFELFSLYACYFVVGFGRFCDRGKTSSSSLCRYLKCFGFPTLSLYLGKQMSIATSSTHRRGRICFKDSVSYTCLDILLFYRCKCNHYWWRTFLHIKELDWHHWRTFLFKEKPKGSLIQMENEASYILFFLLPCAWLIRAWMGC